MAAVRSLRVFPAQARPTPAQMLAVCDHIDGTSLIETFLELRAFEGKSVADAMRSPEFLFAFMRMLDRLSERVKGGAA